MCRRFNDWQTFVGALIFFLLFYGLREILRIHSHEQNPCRNRMFQGWSALIVGLKFRFQWRENAAIYYYFIYAAVFAFITQFNTQV